MLPKLTKTLKDEIFRSKAKSIVDKSSQAAQAAQQQTLDKSGSTGAA